MLNHVVTDSGLFVVALAAFSGGLIGGIVIGVMFLRNIVRQIEKGRG